MGKFRIVDEDGEPWMFHWACAFILKTDARAVQLALQWHRQHHPEHGYDYTKDEAIQALAERKQELNRRWDEKVERVLGPQPKDPPT